MSPNSASARALLLLLASFAGAACSAPSQEEEMGSSEGHLEASDEAGSVLFNFDDVKSIELTLDPVDMGVMTQEAHDAQANPGLLWGERTKAHGTFKVNLAPGVQTSCDTSQPVDVTVKIKGMASMQGFDAKPSLKIAFDKSFCGLKNLALNNMVQDTSFVNESLAYKMYASMGVPVPRHGYSNVSVNGQAFGLYLSLEAIDKKFLARNFGDSSGPIYEGTYGGDLRDGDVGALQLAFNGDDNSPEANGFPQLHELVAAVNAPDDHVFYGPDQLVDTNEFVNMMATAYVIGDWDNYITANNYRIYRSPANGLWSFLPTGTDQTFAEHLHPLNSGRAPSILFAKCLESERCSKDYMAAVGRAVQKLEEPEGTLAGTAQRREALIQSSLPGANDGLAGVIAFIKDRPAEVSQMMALPAPPSDCSLLRPDQGLVLGRRLTSCNGRFTMVVQPADGNVVVYRNDGAVIWSANTPPSTVSFVMQGDGNLVAYDAGGTAVWTSKTDYHPGAALAVQDDGNLVIYENGNAIWTTNTGE